MSAAIAVSSGHEPTKDDDDKLCRATGFRYLPAYERGFPFPWCAKRSKRGWVVRDSPPQSTSKRSESGTEFKGWKEAEKMFRSKQILMKRVENRSGPYTIAKEYEKGKPLKKSGIKPSKMECAVNDWFQNTSKVVETQMKNAQEEEFGTFLKKMRKEYASEVKRDQREKKKAELQRKREEQQRKRKERETERESKREAKRAKGKVEEEEEEKEHQPNNMNHEQSNANDNSSPLLMSPTRRKHKQSIPKRNPQNANSVVLGEDPALDEMIEGIVEEFTQEFVANDHSNSNMKDARGVNFDGSAVSALREAARETLLASHHGSPMTAAVGTQKVGGTGHAQTAAVSSIAAASAAKSSPFKPTKATPKKRNIHADYGGDDDIRIAGMIEQLIGDVEGGTNLHFDGQAIAALKEAAKDIATKDDGSSDSNNGVEC